MQFPLLCEKSGPILLVLVGLTAGWQSDEILVDLKILKFCADRIIRILSQSLTKVYSVITVYIVCI